MNASIQQTLCSSCDAKAYCIDDRFNFVSSSLLLRRCGNKKPIRQAVVVRSGWSETTDGLCSFEINEGNWDTEQNVSIAAKVDFKYDGIQRRQMIVWFRKTIDGATAERRSLANTTVIYILSSYRISSNLIYYNIM